MCVYTVKQNTTTVGSGCKEKCEIRQFSFKAGASTADESGGYTLNTQQYLNPWATPNRKSCNKGRQDNGTSGV